VTASYNTIYEKLTANPNDLVGALAYIIYKKQKVEFCKNHPTGAPDRAELDNFHRIASLQTSVDSYRAQAEALAQAFLTVALDDLADRTETETRQDVLSKQLTTVTTGLQTQLNTVNTGLQTQLNTINSVLDAKRSWVGWGRDVGGNLVVNLLTIVIIGAIVIGYRSWADIQQGAEARVGIGTSVTPGTTAGTPGAAATPSAGAASATQ
jgi:hypothetical protein